LNLKKKIVLILFLTCNNINISCYILGGGRLYKGKGKGHGLTCHTDTQDE